MSATLSHSFDFQTSHLETSGLSENGAAVVLPSHEHITTVDITRLELGVQYTFRPKWALRFTLPFEEKQLITEAGLIDSMTPDQWADAIRGSQAHHPNSDSSGLSDGSLRVIKLWSSVLAHRDQLIVGAGTSLPFGDIDEPVPGEHLKLQFGTGSYDPILDLSYYLKLGAQYEVGAHLFQRFPGGTNEYGFRRGREFTWRVEASRYWQRFRVTAAYTNLRNNQDTRNGTRDENSGLKAVDASLNAAYTFKGAYTIYGTWIHALSQDSIHPLGNTFDRKGSIFVGFALPLNF